MVRAYVRRRGDPLDATRQAAHRYQARRSHDFTAQVNAGDGVNPPPTTPYQGLDHFGFCLGHPAIAADLKKKGVEFTQEPHSPRPGIKICFLRGPQDISIELLDRDPKYS